MTDGQDSGAADSEAGNRFWIEIVSWDWNLSVALSSDFTPVEYRFQGGLDYGRGFELFGRVLAPARHNGKAIRVWIMPFGADITFGSDGLDEVGRVYFLPAASGRTDLRASLLLPAESIAPLGTCLGSVSKYLFLTIFDEDPDEASVNRYAFSSAFPEEVLEAAEP